MSFAALDVGYRAATLLNDTASVRWTATELVVWMNDAALAIVSKAPDATATTMEVTLAAGVKQSLANLAEMAALTPYQLLEVTRNTAATSALGTVRQVTRTILDAQSPNWPAATPSVNVQHFVYDARSPDIFYVYPPATALAKVESLVSMLPAAIAAPPGALWSTITGTVDMVKVYLPVMVDYVCYRALMKDAVVEASVQRAMAFYKSFSDAVGITESATRTTEPSPSSVAGQE
jgi:hypothetical protein